MGAFDEIIRAAMKHDEENRDKEVELDPVLTSKRMDDTKTASQYARDSSKITQEGTRPPLPADVVDPDAKMENREIPPDYIRHYLDQQATKKKDRKA